MLATPIGTRYPEEAEYNLLSFGCSKLCDHIISNIRSEEKKIVHEGIILKPIKQNSVFHELHPRLQLVTLHSTIVVFFDKISLHSMTQIYNSALESLYSCIFHEIECEIKNKGNREARSCVYYAWERWFDGKGHPLNISSLDLNEWVSVIDKLAAKTVFDHNYAKQFELGKLDTIVNDAMVNNSQVFLELLYP